MLQSKETLFRVVRNCPRIVNEDLGDGRTALHLSVHWPWAVSFLLEAGAEIDRMDALGFTPLSYACVAQNVKSVKTLIFEDCGMGSGKDANLCLSEIVSWKDEEMIRTFVSALVDRRYRLHELAQNSLPADHPSLSHLSEDRVLDSEASSIITSLQQMGEYIEPPLMPSYYPWKTTVYHTAGLTSTAATLIYEAGFRDIDEMDESSTTPIWRQACGFINSGEWFELVEWFISKGVNIYQRHPRHAATAIHGCGAAIGRAALRSQLSHLTSNGHLRDGILRSLTEEQKKICIEILGSEFRDECNCACSLGDRSVISVVLKEVHLYAPFVAIGKYALAHEKVETNTQIEIFDFLQSRHRLLPFSHDIIRVMTFDKLGLTHTCPNVFSSVYSYRVRLPLSDVEIQEIQDEERFLIQELNDLVEEFESEFKDYGGTLVSFIEEYWRPRMDAVLEKDAASIEEDEMARIREIGVVLE